MPENITFRSQLIGSVTEFCQASQLQLLANALNMVELIVMLARYKEEGVSLYPKVYLTNDIQTLTSMLPDGEKIKIGSATATPEGIKTAVKKCAPLAINGWLIYMQDNQDSLEFGIFSGSSHPIAVLVDDALLTENGGLIVVKASQAADDCVEIRSNNGGLHYIFLNHRKETSPPPLQFLGQLIDAITDKTKEDIKEPTVNFLTRLLITSLRESHGCIIAVTSMRKPPKFLSSDGIILEKPIDFSDLIHKLKKNEISTTHLESKGYLLKGMLNSDGIILFDNKGRLLGYNCFIKLSNGENVIGGARKRAFSSLQSKLGTGVSATFMQSQDGWTDFKDLNNE